MRTIGMIGGTSWVSTVEYYSHLNRMVNARLGGSHSIKCVLVSLDLAEVIENNERNIEDNYPLVVDAAERLKLARADAIMFGANTMHLFADRLERQVGLPVINIATATAEVAIGKGMRKVGLLGTRFVMEMDFYRSKIEAAGLEALLPEPDDRAFINRAIFEELTLDQFLDETRNRFLKIVESLKSRGADGVVLGCTEI